MQRTLICTQTPLPCLTSVVLMPCSRFWGESSIANKLWLLKITVCIVTSASQEEWNYSEFPFLSDQGREPPLTPISQTHPPTINYCLSVYAAILHKVSRSPRSALILVCSQEWPWVSASHMSNSWGLIWQAYTATWCWGRNLGLQACLAKHQPNSAISLDHSWLGIESQDRHRFPWWFYCVILLSSL